MKISFFIIQCERTAVAKKNFLVTKRSKKSYCLKVKKIIISKNLVWHSRWEWIDFFFFDIRKREKKKGPRMERWHNSRTTFKKKITSLEVLCTGITIMECPWTIESMSPWCQNIAIYSTVGIGIYAHNKKNKEDLRTFFFHHGSSKTIFRIIQLFVFVSRCSKSSFTCLS